MNEQVIKVLKENLWDLATCSKGEPNVVPVAFKNVTDDGKLIVGDVFMDTTARNIQENGRASVSAYDPKTHEGYQVKGSAVYVQEGEVYNLFKALVEKKFNGNATAKGAVIITPEKVIVTTPGPDNNKVL